MFLGDLRGSVGFRTHSRKDLLASQCHEERGVLLLLFTYKCYCYAGGGRSVFLCSSTALGSNDFIPITYSF